MNSRYKNWPVFAILLFAMSCQKKDNSPADASKVTVVFASPVEAQTVHKGDTVDILTNVSYYAEMSGIAVEITDTATGNQLYEDNADTHSDHFTFQKQWVDDLNDSTMLQVKILVFMTNNTTVPAERSIYIKSLP